MHFFLSNHHTSFKCGKILRSFEEGDGLIRESMKEKMISSSSKESAKSSWSRLKDPRIVRVSKAFGGKDRHSKVCTVRGLRDRRVRLSVPTAIQLYDLQERLGLNQPSKVIDWLLNAAKNEIDGLPPLQFSQESFITQNHPIVSQEQDLKITDRDQVNWERAIEVENQGSFMRWDTTSNEPLLFPTAGSHVYPQMFPIEMGYDPQKQVYFHSPQLPSSFLSSSLDSTTQVIGRMTANNLPLKNISVRSVQNQEF